MYAKSYSYNEYNCKPEICKIEVGLSQGIPIIKYFGSISVEYSKSREKIYFIFSSLGRKLPRKKIRVSFSSREKINSPEVDLAVITAIYLASNPTENAKEIHCLGEVDMLGNVTSNKNLSKYLYLISKHKDPEDIIIFTGEGNEHLKKLYPEMKIIQISNISNLFGYFEGSWEEDEDENDRNFEGRITEIDKDSEDLLILIFLSYLSKSKALYITSKQGNLVDIENVLSNSIEVKEKQDLDVRRINSVFSIDKSLAPILIINNENALDLLSQEWIILRDTMPMLIDLTEANKTSIQEFLRKFEVYKYTNWLILMRSCECGLNEGKNGTCICTSRGRDDWNKLIKSIVFAADISLYTEAPHTEFLSEKQRKKILTTKKWPIIKKLNRDYKKGDYENTFKMLKENRDMLTEML